MFSVDEFHEGIHRAHHSSVLVNLSSHYRDLQHLLFYYKLSLAIDERERIHVRDVTRVDELSGMRLSGFALGREFLSVFLGLVLTLVVFLDAVEEFFS